MHIEDEAHEVTLALARTGSDVEDNAKRVTNAKDAVGTKLTSGDCVHPRDQTC